jgi:hypothetical protein
MKYKLIIAGTRTFNDFNLLTVQTDLYLKSICSLDTSNEELDITVLSGCANGADKLGEKYAQMRNYKIEQYPANWLLYGKSAGPRRNKQMACVANICIVFWDGKSKGTKNMITLCNRRKIPCCIINY